ncbi:septum formation family protein [Streptosporangiaceae bacterium NEAU-GS5]|nr:septum formation family protein [Streptosporangiaceae bacterium NEAU-GS5]
MSARRAAQGLLACALLGMTGACGSGEAGTAAKVAQISPDMKVGSCHRMERPEELYNGSDVAPAVACTQPHQTETYMLTKFTGSLAAARERPSPEQLGAAIGKACDYALIRPYLGAGPRDGQWGIGVWGKFPTRAAWAAGDRTLRCDLLVPTLTDTRGPEISVPLRGIMAREDSALVRRCRFKGTDTICARPHDAEWLEPPIWLGWKAYPGDAAAQRRAARLCTAQARTFVRGPLGDLKATFDPITRQTWDQGDRQLACWLGRADGAATQGTLRGGLDS